MGRPSSSRGGGRRRSLPAAAFLLLLLLFFAVALTGHCASASRVMRSGGTGVAPQQGKEEENTWVPASTAAARRGLVGPGSSPPTCRSRCGGCHPCRPVHVAIQPGMSFPLEYYPEAWRCKCGNKLFMP